MIAKNYLVHRQLNQNGLTTEEVSFGVDALKKIIQGYTREAGVRNLEREIGTICRRIAVKIVSREITDITVTSDHVRDFLKKVILPKHNESDVNELPEEVRQSIEFLPVEWIDDALKIALIP